MCLGLANRITWLGSETNAYLTKPFFSSSLPPPRIDNSLNSLQMSAKNIWECVLSTIYGVLDLISTIWNTDFSSPCWHWDKVVLRELLQFRPAENIDFSWSMLPTLIKIREDRHHCVWTWFALLLDALRWAWSQCVCVCVWLCMCCDGKGVFLERSECLWGCLASSHLQR